MNTGLRLSHLTSTNAAYGSFVWTILATGAELVGSTPVEGAGTRFMWLPHKGAVRAGVVDGTQWDDANIGFNSAAFGGDVRASGDFAFAAGADSAAVNSYSIALGHFVTASGAASVGLGYYAHTNTRQGSFVFSDRSVLDDGNPVTDESFKAASNHSFNVRATGGYYLFTNSSAVDIAGATLAGVQALDSRTVAMQGVIDAQQQEIDELKARLARLEALLSQQN